MKGPAHSHKAVSPETIAYTVPIAGSVLLSSPGLHVLGQLIPERRIGLHRHHQVIPALPCLQHCRNLARFVSSAACESHRTNAEAAPTNAVRPNLPRLKRSFFPDLLLPHEQRGRRTALSARHNPHLVALLRLELVALNHAHVSLSHRLVSKLEGLQSSRAVL